VVVPVDEGSHLGGGLWRCGEEEVRLNFGREVIAECKAVNSSRVKSDRVYSESFWAKE
jgi:hypothetical protein